MLKVRNLPFDPKGDLHYWDQFDKTKFVIDKYDEQIDNENKRLLNRIQKRLENKWKKNHENLPKFMQQQNRSSTF